MYRGDERKGQLQVFFPAYFVVHLFSCFIGVVFQEFREFPLGFPPFAFDYESSQSKWCLIRGAVSPSFEWDSATRMSTEVQVLFDSLAFTFHLFLPTPTVSRGPVSTVSFSCLGDVYPPVLV